jgi:hypothetical protein
MSFNDGFNIRSIPWPPNTPVSGSTIVYNGSQWVSTSESGGTIIVDEVKEQKFKKLKKLLTIQLDTPATASIASSGSHTYAIDLGEEYSQLAITKFEWVEPSLVAGSPDTVIANASLPKGVNGGVLLVNKSPGGWLRSFEIPNSEFQDGNLTDVDAPYDADSTDVSAPLGYGSGQFENVLDHINLQTVPPKKLQIEDAYLDGNYLKITIKNYDSSSVTLTPYAGLIALSDGSRACDLGAVSENGVIAYTSYTTFFANGIRLSEDGGATFKLLHPYGVGGSVVNLRPSALALTNDGVNTFIGLYNYTGIRIAQSPDYIFTASYDLPTNLPNINPLHVGHFNASQPVGGKTFDWKKTLSESCALFAGFLNYYTIQVFKSVDNCFSFGNNSPNFNNNQPIFNAGANPGDTPPEQLADFRDTEHPNFGTNLLKAQVKVINNNIHYLSLSYFSKEELFNNGFPTYDLFIGPQVVTGVNGSLFELRDTEVAFANPSYFNSGFGRFKITGSIVGNDGEVQTGGNGITGFLPVYYAGNVTVGAESVSMSAHELALLKSDWDAASPVVKVGDRVLTPFAGGLTLASVRDATIDSVQYKIVGTYNLINLGDTTAAYSTWASEDGSPTPGSPLTTWGSGIQFQTGESGRAWPINSKSYWVFNNYTRTFAAESSPSASVSSSSPNLSFIFRNFDGIQKSILLKTTDGGSTWNSVMEHPEFRYSPANITHVSNDGQTILLSAIRYWTGPGYEKWPYSYNPSIQGSYARFNISTDGGATWRNNTGSWDDMGSGYLAVQYGRPGGNGQVMSSISGSILAVLITNDNIPVLIRSLDNGLTWGPKILLKNVPGNLGNSFASFGSDSKDNFMGFFGNQYANSENQWLFYGKIVDKYTQWPTYGVK